VNDPKDKPHSENSNPTVFEAINSENMLEIKQKSDVNSLALTTRSSVK
jgi:hypothetical protein